MRLAHEVLGRSLDELPPQTRRLLGLICRDGRASTARAAAPRARATALAAARCASTRGWGDTQLRIHLARLVELEYLLVHRGGRGQSFEYELLLRWGGASDARRT